MSRRRVLSCPVHATFLVVCCSVFVFASDFCLFVSTTRGRGLTCTSPLILVRAHIDEPGCPSTDTMDHTLCVVRALVPTLAVQPPHVCHRRATGQSPWARACSKRWVFLRRLNIWALRFNLRQTVHVTKTTIQKNGHNFPPRDDCVRYAFQREFCKPRQARLPCHHLPGIFSYQFRIKDRAGIFFG